MKQAAFVYQDTLSSYQPGDDHALKPPRLRLTYELLDSYGAFCDQHSSVVEPEPASETDLGLFHTSDYIEAVKRYSQGDITGNPLIYGFSEEGDNPIFEGMYEAAALAVGASLLAADLVANERVDIAFNGAGGLHHAGPSAASGFCIFNDAVIAIKHLTQQGAKVAYVDIDAHHGDWVQGAFSTTNQVLTISLHESGRYLFPGTGAVREIGEEKGRGFSVNVPFAPYTDDEIYLWAFDQVVPPLLHRFNADFVFTQLGTDAHYLDPLAHLRLTTEGYTELVKRFSELAQRWVALGGGGYDLATVTRVWALEYGIMIGNEWPDDIPTSFQERYGLKKLRDAEKPQLSDTLKQRARIFAEAQVEEIQKTVFPIHRI